MVLSANVQPFTCGYGSQVARPITRDQDWSNQLHDPIAEVVLVDHHLLYYRVEFSPLTQINDANYTNGLYSTLNVRWNFMGDDPINQSVRLCDYIHPLQNQSLDLIVLTNETGAVPNRNRTQCPLDPNQRYNIFSITDISSPRYFGSYETKFTIQTSNFQNLRDEDDQSGCILLFPTLTHPKKITYSMTFGVLIIFIFGFIASFYIFNFSPHQETTNILLIIASSICNEPLLNELTPDIVMFLKFLQFVVLSMGLNLNYPGFLQPLITYSNWVVLITIDFFSNKSINGLSKDGVYQSFGIRGLFGLFPEGDKLPDGETASHLWNTFIIWIWCAIGFLIIMSQLYLSFKQSILRDCQISSYKSRFFFTIGIIIQFFYSYFPLPFISFSSFLFYGLSKDSNVQTSSVTLSILFLIIWLIFISWFMFYVIVRNKNKLYSSFKIISCWSSLYYYYKPKSSYFVVIEMIKTISEGFIIGFGQSNGTIQVALLIFIELVYFMALLIVQPCFNRARNIWCCFSSLFSLLIVSLSVSYITNLDVSMVKRSFIGYTQLLLTCTFSVAFFLSFVYKVVYVARLRMKHDFTKPIIEEDTISESSPDVELFDFEIPYDYFPVSTDNSFSFDAELLNKPSTSHHTRQASDTSTSSVHEKLIKPPAVSPINDGYLAKMDQNDSEVRKLWARRRKRGKTNIRRVSNVSSIDFKFNPFMKKPVNQGFEVVGRKDIGANQDRVQEKESLLQIPSKSKNKKPKNEFVILGRKPIVFQENVATNDDE
ncbi:hypothetical protein WICANDRAFT_59661 [Wickerhamomyces anomalus NRRL Y-366-8]|uniref:TRP C-terminal domain-containing protein n=1 Tax=Wickerhamomyces anomalus (strain ATCC 58044 / CBS 1984 / NCYC 433 / NRRL Y-366-8) TaxID=683960 RepID=A0A1E3P839_WICAA|nr:uncharacterized protein WICANDRAFT_59661 [Wickerhamomyces anomalus NRRL Y-366-8]ODQ61576.1 hypothetical protein WICANDRAFT_59661 [Wickerhamomyces anomalus NRRL Y-366-8]